VVKGFTNNRGGVKGSFELNRDSASGLDGLTGCFFQSSWNIIGVDILRVVIAFFEGNFIPM
ncbi:hypothetical protein HAX54_027648, partial [Datura stramonium]|nr:hypothetical protein [Datura stramonium]